MIIVPTMAQTAEAVADGQGVRCVMTDTPDVCFENRPDFIDEA
jgi:hypothetical protein